MEPTGNEKAHLGTSHVLPLRPASSSRSWVECSCARVPCRAEATREREREEERLLRRVIVSGAGVCAAARLFGSPRSISLPSFLRDEYRPPPFLVSCRARAARGPTQPNHCVPRRLRLPRAPRTTTRTLVVLRKKNVAPSVRPAERRSPVPLESSLLLPGRGARSLPWPAGWAESQSCLDGSRGRKGC